MNIVTERAGHGYYAYVDETYDIGEPLGHGMTEREAIEDLLDKMEDITVTRMKCTECGERE